MVLFFWYIYKWYHALFFTIDADVKQPSKKGSSSSGSGSDSESDDAGPPLPPSMKRASAGPSSSKVQDDEDDDDMVGPPLPAGMKISSKAADSDDDEIGPPLPPGMQNRLEEEDDEEGEDLADDVSHLKWTGTHQNIFTTFIDYQIKYDKTSLLTSIYIFKILV